MKYYWLSFCDTDRPEGSQFVGGFYVEAPDVMGAVMASYIFKCNPGGEVKISELSIRVPQHLLYKLVTDKELIEQQGMEVVRYNSN